MRRPAAAVLGLVLVASVHAAPARAATATLTIVGRADLGSRGMNAGLAIGATCAYVGSRNDSAPVVVDIRDPTHPVVAGSLQGRAGSTPRELRAVGALREVVVMFYAVNGRFNGFDLYRWDSDCIRPTLVGTLDLGSVQPHEFFLWQDPVTPSRVLLYSTVFGGASNGLRVIDISEPAAPRILSAWHVPAGYPGNAEAHSISVTDDGRTAYVSLWTGGLVVADVGDFASGAANPTIRPLTAPGSAVRTAPGNVHSAVLLPGTSMIVITDERYPAPYGAGCPSGPAHVVDVSSPAAPRVVGTIAIPENNPAACAANPTATWTSHNPTLTAHLGLLSWYSGGLQAVDLADPVHPQLLAELRPDGVAPRLRDLQLGTTASLTWSYPVIAGGLVYVVDINQGLLVVSYHGPHEVEVGGSAFTEGNSNVRVAAAAPSPAISPSPGPSPATSASPVPAPRVTSQSSRLGPALAGAGLAVLSTLVLVGLLVSRRRRSGLG